MSEETTTEQSQVVPPPPVQEPDYSWATKLVEDKAWVLHTPTRTLSRASAFYDGVKDVYVSTHNGQPVKGPVLMLENGSSFVAKMQAPFIPLADKEVQFFLGARLKVAESVQACAKEGGMQGMAPQTAFLLIGIALREAAQFTDQAPSAIKAAREKKATP